MLFINKEILIEDYLQLLSESNPIFPKDDYSLNFEDNDMSLNKLYLDSNRCDLDKQKTNPITFLEKKTKRPENLTNFNIDDNNSPKKNINSNENLEKIKIKEKQVYKKQEKKYK